MIGSFYDSVKREEKKRKVPNSVIKELNMELPRGYQYVMDEEKGHLIIQESSGMSEQMVVNINLDEEGIPADIPPERVMDYIYRTQRPIHIHNARIEKQGKTLYLREMNKDPVTGEDADEDGYEMLIPAEFPPAMPIHMKTEDGAEVDIMFRRQPYGNLEASKFANESFPALKIEWIVPDKRTRVGEDGKRREIPATINITAKATEAENTSDAITALKIFRGYADGTLIMHGKKIGKDLVEHTGIDIEKLDEHIAYWTDLQKVEKILGVSFDPRVELKEDNRQFCLELIAMFVYDEDVVYKEPFGHFHIGEIQFNDSELKEEDLVGKEGIGFSFTNGPEKHNLYGVEFDIYEAVTLIGFRLDQVVRDDDGKGMEMYISSPDDDAWKLVRRYCLTKDEADKKHEEMYRKFQMKG